MSAEIPTSVEARALCALTHDMGRGMHSEYCAYCPEIQRALTAAREAGAREERERWYVNLYDLADRIKKGL